MSSRLSTESGFGSLFDTDSILSEINIWQMNIYSLPIQNNQLHISFKKIKFTFIGRRLWMERRIAAFRIKGKKGQNTKNVELCEDEKNM